MKETAFFWVSEPAPSATHVAVGLTLEVGTDMPPGKFVRVTSGRMLPTRSIASKIF